MHIALDFIIDENRRIIARTFRLPTDIVTLPPRQILNRQGKIRRNCPQSILQRHGQRHLLQQYNYQHSVSDGTGTAEASLIYKKIPADVKLPKVGDSVIVIGSGYRKILGGSKNAYSFPKIHVCSIGVITPEE